MNTTILADFQMCISVPLTLHAATQQNGKTDSNNSLAKVDELSECV